MYNGNNKFHIKINNTSLSGEYKCSCLYIDNAINSSIEYSTIEKGYGSENINGGAGLNMAYSEGSVKHTTFKDNFSIQSGGSISLSTVYNFLGEYLEIYNTTSLLTGSMAYVISDYNVNNFISFSYVKLFNAGGYKGMKGGGLVICAEQFANVELKDFYGENIINNESSGGAFILTGEASLSIRNVEIDKITSHSISGLLLFTYNVDLGKKVVFNAYNFTLKNLSDFSSRASAALLWMNERTKVYIENGNVQNFEGTFDHLIYGSDFCNLHINGLIIDNFYSRTVAELIHFNSINAERILIEKVKLNKIKSRGAFFHLAHGTMKLNEIEITNSHTCDYNKECTNKNDIDIDIYESDIISLGNASEVTLTNSYFYNINGIKGIVSNYDSKFNLKNNTFINCNFKNGIYYVDYNRKLGGSYNDKDSKYINIKSEYGSIINIKYMKESSETSFDFRNVFFENNHASKYGGVIYTLSKYSKRYINLVDCKFKNNTALNGYIVYSYNKDSEPTISNIKELRKEKGALATNPTKIKFNKNSLFDVAIYSGEKLPSGISCNIFDDYDNLISFETDISNIQFDELLFYKLEINDTYNARLKGQTQSYCWGESCNFPQINVIGNPGKYKIKLTINTFGKFSYFENNSIEKEIEIIECNTSSGKYIYQSIESSRLKSCYEPFCDQGCKSGKCVNNNVCDCEGTLRTGKHCDEYYKMERNKILDNLFRIIGVLMIIGIIIIIIITLILKKNPKIKGGSVDFLIIILIGSIISVIYMFYLTIERTTTRCLFIYLFDNLGFSLVFGSILVKTLRIYKIFQVTKGRNYGLKRIIMYEIVFGIVSYHIVVCVFWILTSKTNVESFFTADFHLYKKCVYSKTKIICTLLNFSILLVGCFLSYSVRNVQKNFKENLVIPVYIYVLFRIITEMFSLQEGISLKVQDLIGSISTIINISVTLYYIFISKFYNIYEEAYVHRLRSTPGSANELNANHMYGSKKNLINGSNLNMLSNNQLYKYHSNNTLGSRSLSNNQIYKPIIKKSDSNSSYNYIFNSSKLGINLNESNNNLYKTYSSSGLCNKIYD
ncbi:hypothetical protein BCR36DRAFT_413546 [Piromyces finnis]|uniref:G-protein coupled receptors family 3 profile domain-containing protein n=1 Tax=Piromyces finnis TaxID=1754191 RepID=A0A1Y1V5A0_9FUNG|nr:hypothetical protein BCR36DRAFT_413546 [Piromyces finnis]|eukprot:ORX47605.1 hypothetical protein BCR36DRAFT_413546 [Piromyces finnis]